MKSMTKTTFGAVLAIASVVVTTGIASSQSSTNKAVEARHAQMSMIGYHTGVLGGIAKGEIPYDSAMVDAAAANLNALAKMAPATLWIEGTEQGTVDGSRAKAEVWSDNAGFVDGFAKLEQASEAMIGAADQAAVGAGMGAIGGSCKACHEAYRGPKN